MLGVVEHVKGVPGDVSDVSVGEVGLLPVVYESIKGGF